MPDRLVALALVLVTAGACTSVAPPPPARVALPFPSPLEGPGAPAAAEGARAAVGLAWQRLAAGDAAGARAAVAPAGDAAIARLLRLQTAVGEDPAAAVDPLAELTRQAPEYAAAWATLAHAAEAAGREATALEAAVTSARLWPGSRWSEAAPRLRTRYLEERLARARQVLATDSAAALALAEEVLALAPQLEEARLLRAEALLTADADAAEAALADLHSPRAVLVRGRAAEQRGDWSRALSLYQSLPDGTPGREEALERVRLRWRLANLPPHVQQAVGSAALTREELAVLLVALAPQLETLAGGAAPVLPDVVGLASQREILTAVRLGLVPVDAVERRFDPDRPVNVALVRAGLERVADVLGGGPVRWCAGDGQGGCVPEPTAATGAELTLSLLALAETLP